MSKPLCPKPKAGRLSPLHKAPRAPEMWTRRSREEVMAAADAILARPYRETRTQRTSNTDRK